MPKKPQGAVYLIHFNRKLSHAQHYIGYTKRPDVTERIGEHRKSAGAKLMQAVNAAGIDWQHVRTWYNASRTFERALKNRKKARVLCPICNIRAMEFATNDRNNKRNSKRGADRVCRGVQRNQAV